MIYYYRWAGTKFPIVHSKGKGKGHWKIGWKLIVGTSIIKKRSGELHTYVLTTKNESIKGQCKLIGEVIKINYVIKLIINSTFVIGSQKRVFAVNILWEKSRYIEIYIPWEKSLLLILQPWKQ